MTRATHAAAGSRALLTLRSQAPTEVLEREPETGRPLTVRAQSGVLAHFQRRPDDCHAAAVATLLQVAYRDVPDARIDERLAGGEEPDAVNAQVRAEFAAWLADRGLCEVSRPQRPQWGPWLGQIPGHGHFASHVVVCVGRHVVHDPATNWPCPPGFKVAPCGPIVTAITIEPTEAP